MPGFALGLRERKKRQTRDDIVQAAMKLFAARGFDGATVAEIAEAADISPRTFFGYFPTKEDVVFHDHDELLASLTERIRSRAPGEDPFDALRAWVVELDAEQGFERAEERVRRRLIRETPTLAARERSNLSEVEALLAEAVADDLGVDRRSLRPHLVSAAAIAGLSAIGRLRDDDELPPRSAGEVLDEALLFLQGGLDALRRAPDASAPAREHAGEAR